MLRIRIHINAEIKPVQPHCALDSFDDLMVPFSHQVDWNCDMIHSVAALPVQVLFP